MKFEDVPTGLHQIAHFLPPRLVQALPELQKEPADDQQKYQDHGAAEAVNPAGETQIAQSSQHGSHLFLARGIAVLLNSICLKYFRVIYIDTNNFLKI